MVTNHYIIGPSTEWPRLEPFLFCPECWRVIRCDPGHCSLRSLVNVVIWISRILYNNIDQLYNICDIMWLITNTTRVYLEMCPCLGFFGLEILCFWLLTSYPFINDSIEGTWWQGPQLSIACPLFIILQAQHGSLLNHSVWKNVRSPMEKNAILHRNHDGWLVD